MYSIVIGGMEVDKRVGRMGLLECIRVGLIIRLGSLKLMVVVVLLVLCVCIDIVAK